MAAPLKKEPNKYAKNADIKADTPLKTIISVVGARLLEIPDRSRAPGTTTVSGRYYRSSANSRGQRRPALARRLPETRPALASRKYAPCQQFGERRPEAVEGECQRLVVVGRRRQPGVVVLHDLMVS